MQKPQWTQRFSMASARATVGSWSCRGRNWCAWLDLDPGIHAARIENSCRIERSFQPRGEGCERRLERLEHVDARARSALGADQRGVAANSAMARRISTVPASVVAGASSQISPPDQS